MYIVEKVMEKQSTIARYTIDLDFTFIEFFPSYGSALQKLVTRKMELSCPKSNIIARILAGFQNRRNMMDSGFFGDNTAFSELAPVS
jgi:hypothetical protein